MQFYMEDRNNDVSRDISHSSLLHLIEIRRRLSFPYGIRTVSLVVSLIYNNETSYIHRYVGKKL